MHPTSNRATQRTRHLSTHRPTDLISIRRMMKMLHKELKCFSMVAFCDASRGIAIGFDGCRASSPRRWPSAIDLSHHPKTRLRGHGFRERHRVIAGALTPGGTGKRRQCDFCFAERRRAVGVIRDDASLILINLSSTDRDRLWQVFPSVSAGTTGPTEDTGARFLRFDAQVRSEVV